MIATVRGHVEVDKRLANAFGALRQDAHLSVACVQNVCVVSAAACTTREI